MQQKRPILQRGVATLLVAAVCLGLQLRVEPAIAGGHPVKFSTGSDKAPPLVGLSDRAGKLILGETFGKGTAATLWTPSRTAAARVAWSRARPFRRDLVKRSRLAQVGTVELRI